MAIQPGYAGLLNAAMPRIGQYEASTGRRINRQFVQGLLQADLDKAKEFAMQNYWRQREMDIAQQRTNLMEHQQAQQNRAAQAGGYGQLAQLPVAYYAADKAGLIPSLGGGSTVAAGSMSPVVGGTAQGALGAVGTAGGAQLGTAAVPGVTGTVGGVQAGSSLGTTAGGMSTVGGEASMGLGMEAGAGAGTAGLAAAGAGTAGALLGKTGGHYLAKPLGVNQRSAERYGGIVGGAAAGFTVAGPVGAVIGGAIGFLASLF